MIVGTRVEWSNGDKSLCVKVENRNETFFYWLLDDDIHESVNKANEVFEEMSDLEVNVLDYAEVYSEKDLKGLKEKGWVKEL